MTNELPNWLVARAEETAASWGMPFSRALQMELSSARTIYGWPLPEEDPRETARKQQERERIERVERAMSPAYDPARFTGGSE